MNRRTWLQTLVASAVGLVAGVAKADPWNSLVAIPMQPHGGKIGPESDWRYFDIDRPIGSIQVCTYNPIDTAELWDHLFKERMNFRVTSNIPCYGTVHVTPARICVSRVAPPE